MRIASELIQRVIDGESVVDLVNEAITPEERKTITAFSRDLKKKLNKHLKLKLRISVSKSKNPNPWITAESREKEFPNDFRLKVVKSIGATPLNPEDVSYGNIRSNSVALHYEDWQELLKELRL